MKTIPQLTREIISRKPFLLELIAENLINLTALARSIQPEIENINREKVSVGSILMALKRHQEIITGKAKKIEECISYINNVMLISNLTEFTFSSVTNEGKKQSMLSQIRKIDSHAFLSYIKGVYELTIITDSNHEEDIERIYKNDKKTGKEKNMSALILQLPPDNIDVMGLYYYIFKQLAWDGIPISEVVSTQNELILIIKEIYIEQAFLLIQRLRT
ncbi:MAG: hypothetical protein ABFR05_02680 [Bacteroidota bacterium]